ncbi:MAG TPA: hypothetical protein VKU03_03340 [Roseiarcus sp.]|nr:hypothetical protein [Roseiarcus sp.]
MTKLLDQAVETARRLGPDQQDQIARMMLFYAETPVIQLTPEEDADLAAAEEEVARGELATDEQMRAIWAKHQL